MPVNQSRKKHEERVSITSIDNSGDNEEIDAEPRQKVQPVIKSPVINAANNAAAETVKSPADQEKDQTEEELRSQN